MSILDKDLISGEFFSVKKIGRAVDPKPNEEHEITAALLARFREPKLIE